MPSIERDGATLFYRDEGEGSAVVLQHPLTSEGGAWSAIGVTEALVAAGLRVIVPDALGHGRSSPASRDRNGLAARVADVLAVVDHLDIDTFHYAGYSMGGWIGIGLINAVPSRLRSAALLGWDPIDGARRFTRLGETAERNLEFKTIIAELISRVPGRPPISAEMMAGYVGTYERLFRDLPSIVTLVGQDFPILLGTGVDDPYAEPVAEAAEALAVDNLRIPGDHVSAFLTPEFKAALVSWVSSVAAA